MDINGIKRCIWQVQEGAFIVVHRIKESEAATPRTPGRALASEQESGCNPAQ